MGVGGRQSVVRMRGEGQYVGGLRGEGQYVARGGLLGGELGLVAKIGGRSMQLPSVNRR